MDMDALHSALLSITMVSRKLRAARETMQELNNATTPGLSELLDETEKELRMAKATLAGELGFEVCPRCWPPETVATDPQGRLTCPNCGEISYEEAA